jgi:hypothetical protein
MMNQHGHHFFHGAEQSHGNLILNGITLSSMKIFCVCEESENERKWV